MQNWSVDESYLKKFPRKYKIWRLIQLISYGLDGERLGKVEVKKNWREIAPELDSSRRAYLEFLLWGKQF